ncbi:hypothetical protein C8R45DRAFT_931729 [Mycena sanguinolenta]|nr:hypothetical protein C8R45DRAFT_931729 [Mycena sanguinolenta]
MSSELALMIPKGWAPSRPCDVWSPSAMNVDSLTHVNFAFAYISDTFEVISMTPGDSNLWTQTTALKARNPSLKPTSGIFSALTASSASTNTFINSVLAVMQSFAFDGIDIDWEYPAVEDRGGSPSDKANYPTFLKAVKAAFTPFGYELSFTAPSSYWYLQGTSSWDSPADYIGSIVLAHTNLTEIMLTMQLYANRPGFYGRSFELSSADCTDPGCPFAGAAPAGTLMFSEIQNILSAGSVELVFDEAAAVKYLIYNSLRFLFPTLVYFPHEWTGRIDWVSYDDQQTLAMKLQYANSIYLGGTMVWSLDQDDSSFTALSALWGDVTGNNASSSITAECLFHYIPLGFFEKNPLTLEVCGASQDSALCCPRGDAPQSWTWRGADALGSGVCDGTCLEGEIFMGFSQTGITNEIECLVGEVALCCASNQNTEEYCSATDCGVTTSHAGSSPMTTVLSTPGAQNLYDIDLTNCNRVREKRNDWAFSFITPMVPSVSAAPAITVAMHQTVDYDDNEGTPDDTTTGAGSSSILSDDGNENTSPFSSVFISSPNAASVSSWTLNQTGSSQLVMPQATSPKQSVNAYCTCQIDEEDCGCGHVFIGQAADTIVKMPASCGLGPYARVTSLQVHPDQTVLSAEHMARKRSTEPVFTDISEDNGPIYMRADMTDIQGYWDSVIDSPPDAGTTSVKRGLNFHHPQGYQPRSLEKLNNTELVQALVWLVLFLSCPNFQSSLDISVTGYSSIPSISKRSSFSLRFASMDSQFGYYLEATVVPAAVQQAYVYFKAGAGAQGKIQELLPSLLPALLPPPGIVGVMSLSVSASLDCKAIFFFYYPGLLTLGPSVSLSGTYQTTVAYTFPSLDLSFGKQDSDAGQSNFGSPVGPTSNSDSRSYSVGYNVELSGSADVHLIPSLQLGVSVLGGSLIDVQVFVEADMFAGLSITGSVSKAIAPQFCITTHIGVSLNARLTGSLLYWQTGPISRTFYSIQSDSEPGCFDSVTESADGSTLLLEPAVDTTPVISDSFSTDHSRPFESPTITSESQPAHAVTHNGRTIYPKSHWEREGLRESSTFGPNRRAVPLLSGSLFCPSVNSDITADPTNCDPYAGDATPLSRRDVLDEESFRTKGVNRDVRDEAIHILSKRADEGTWCLRSGLPSDFGWCNPRVDPWAALLHRNHSRGQPSLVAATNNVVIYGRYAAIPISVAQNPTNILTKRACLSSLFIDYLHQFEDVWKDGTGNSFCQWINKSGYRSGSMPNTNESHSNLWTVPPYMPAGSTPVADQIGKCYPSRANSGAVGIPVLEQMANVYKQSAFYVTQQSLDQGTLTTAPGIVNSDTFMAQCPSLQVSTLRSLAMITRSLTSTSVSAFMNSLPARDQFLQTNNCIRAIYQACYIKTRSGRQGANLPPVADFVGLYNSWCMLLQKVSYSLCYLLPVRVRDVVAGIQGAIQSKMDTLIPLFNGVNIAAVDVKLSTNPVLSAWAKLNPPVPVNVAWALNNNQAKHCNSQCQFDFDNKCRSGLTALRNNVPAINWIPMLP